MLLIEQISSATATLAMAKASRSTFEYNIFAYLGKGWKIKIRVTDNKSANIAVIMLLIHCFYLLLKIKNLFKARKNAAKCSISFEKFQN